MQRKKMPGLLQRLRVRSGVIVAIQDYGPREAAVSASTA
jgi:hypothetical protein